MFSPDILRLEKSEALEKLAYNSRHGHHDLTTAYSVYIGWLYLELQKSGVEIKEVAVYGEA